METLFNGLNNAYILFSLALFVYAVILMFRGQISGDFWGAMWTNTGLAAAIFIVALILTAQGLRPYGNPDAGESDRIRYVYYLYGIYFIISLPGLFTILKGNDNSRAALYFAGVALFNAAAAYRAAYQLIGHWA